MRTDNGQNRAASVATIAVLVLAVVGVLVFLFLGRPKPVKVALTTPRPPRTPEPTATAAPMSVYVTGAVVNPNQTYTLPAGSRVDAAIAAAGGALPSADLTRVNLADVLRDGAQVYVPAIAQPVIETATPVGGERINVNTATVDELDALPGIGPSLAQRIIDDRAANGPFTAASDLERVSGIGPVLIDSIRELIRFE